MNVWVEFNLWVEVVFFFCDMLVGEVEGLSYNWWFMLKVLRELYIWFLYVFVDIIFIMLFE